MRLHLCGVRGSTPAPGAEFLRYGGHTSCVALAHDGAAAPALILDAGHRPAAGHPAAGGPRRSRARSCSPTCTGTTCTGCRSSRRATATTPGSRCSCPQQPGGAAAEVLGRGMSPPHFPITPNGLRGDWTFGMLEPGPAQGRGLHGRGAGDAAQGRPDVRLPGQRRAVGDRLHPRPLPHRRRAGARGLGRIPPGRARPGRRRRTCSSTTRSCCPRRWPPRPRSGTRRPTTRWAWASGPGPGGSCCSTTSPAAPTRSWTSWPRGSRPGRWPGGRPRAAQGHRGRRRRDTRAVSVRSARWRRMPGG